MSEELKFPIGNYIPKEYSSQLRDEWLADIKFLPAALENAVSNMDEGQLHTPYRPEGWTVHQLIHHIADSHMNAYIRFKLAYTEENPTIKPYEEKLWATTADVTNLPINISMTLLHSLHARWHEFLKSLSEEDFQRTVFHPEQKKSMSLWFLLGLYAWHSRHHTAHIINLKERMSWQ